MKALADELECLEDDEYFSLLGAALHRRCMSADGQDELREESNDEELEEYSGFSDDESSEESELFGDSEECYGSETRGVILFVSKYLLQLMLSSVKTQD